MPEKTEAQKKAQRKYMQGKSTIQLVMEPERRDEIKAHAAARGESVNGFIGRAITETMERDGGWTDSPDNAPVSPSDGVSGGGGIRAQDATEMPSGAAQTSTEGK